MTTAATAFAAFREAVLDNHPLLSSLRRSLDRDAYIASVVAAGAERGFAFDGAVVRAAMRAGEEAWLLQGADIV